MFTRLKKYIKVIAIIITVIVALLTVVSGYSGYISPSQIPMMGVLGMIFPALLLVQICITLGWLLCRHLRIAIVSFAVLIAVIPPAWIFCPLNIGGDKDKYAGDSTFSLLFYNVESFYIDPSLPASKLPYNATFSNLININADINCFAEWSESSPSNPITQEQYDTIDPLFPTWYEKLGYELAVFSRYPIINPQCYTTLENTFQLGSFDTEIAGKKFTVFVLHLLSFHLTTDERDFYKNLTTPKMARKNIDSIDNTISDIRFSLLAKLKEGFSKRALQADSVRAIIDSVPKQANVIVCGDFNDIPDSYTWRKIRGRMKDACSEAAFGPNITFNSYHMFFRIDNIFYSGALKAIDAYSVKRRSSDHYPLYARFKLTPD